MWKENRSVHFDEAPKAQSSAEAAAEGRKRPDIPKSARLEPGEKSSSPEAEADKAAASARADELLAEMNAAEAAKNAVTPAGLLARLDVLEANKRVSPAATKGWRTHISSPNFNPNSDTSKRVITEIDKLEAGSALAKAPVAPQDGIDIDKLEKVKDGELDEMLAVIPDKERVDTKDPLADYAEFFPKKNNGAATGAAPNLAPEEPSYQEVSDEALKTRHIAGIETTHNATGKAIADLKARVVEARQAFKDAMSSPEGRNDLMLRVKEADFKDMEAALQALKTNYDSEGLALAIIKNSSSERFDVNVNAFADLNSSIQKGLDTVMAQLSAANEANNEIARKLQQKAQNQAEEEARVAEPTNAEAATVEEQEISPDPETEAKFRQTMAEVGNPNLLTTIEGKKWEEPKKEAESEEFSDLALGYSGQMASLEEDIQKLSSDIGADRLQKVFIGQLEKLQGRDLSESEKRFKEATEKDLKALNKELDVSDAVALKTQSDALEAKIKIADEQLRLKRKALTALEVIAGTGFNRQRYEKALNKGPQDDIDAKEIGNYLVSYKGSPLLLLLGKEFATKSKEHLKANSKFGLYLAQLNDFIESAKTLASKNPDLNEVISRYKQAIINTAVKEVSSPEVPRLQDAQLSKIGKEFTKLVLTIGYLEKLKGKIPDSDIAKMRAELATNTKKAQAEINEKYTVVTTKESFNKLFAEGYISKSRNDLYQAATSGLALVEIMKQLEAPKFAFDQVKNELLAAAGDGYIPAEETVKIKASTIDDMSYLQERHAFHNNRIPQIAAMIAKGVDFPEPKGDYLAKLKLMNVKDAEVFVKDNSAMVLASKQITAENVKAFNPDTEPNVTSPINQNFESISLTPEQNIKQTADIQAGINAIKAKEEAERLARAAQDAPIDLTDATARLQAELAKAPEVKTPTAKEAAFDKELEAMLTAAQENKQTVVAQSPEKAKVDPALQETADKMHLAYNEAVTALGKIEDSSSPDYQAALEKMRKAAVDYALAEGKVRTQDKDALGDAVTKILTGQNLVKADAFIYGENEAELKTFALNAIQGKAEEDAARIAANTMDFDVVEVDEKPQQPAPPAVAPTPAPPEAASAPMAAKKTRRKSTPIIVPGRVVVEQEAPGQAPPTQG